MIGYDPALWGPLLQSAHVEDLAFRGDVRPAERADRRRWEERLAASPFSAWAAAGLAGLTHLVRMRRDDCYLEALVPSADLPGALQAGLRRVLSMRRVFDGSRPAFLAIHHAHLPSLREADPEGGPPGPEHVNGGMTTGQCGGPIVCYRAEEAPKVWVHEYLHHRCAESSLRHVFVGPGNLAEAYAETWATLWNLLHTVLEESAAAAAPRERLVSALRREREHVLDQAARILYHQGARRSWREVDPDRWREGTNLWSYYVLRAAWLFDPDRFLRTCPSPQSGLGLGPSLRWLAEDVLASAPWAEDVARRLARCGAEAAETPGKWSLRMTRAESPLVVVKNSTPLRQARRTDPSSS